MRPIVLIVGPTAGGKTELALALAERLPLRSADRDAASDPAGGISGGSGPRVGGEIISADSMQVYRGMDIGSAKPTAAEQARAPHHLIDIVDPDEPFSVDDWRRRAEAVIAEIRGRGRWPIVVGGTNLYIKILLEGMFEGPGADEAFRDSLQDVESAELHRRLAAVDPVAAERIHPNDRKRLVRSLEVHHLTGQPISQLQRQWMPADAAENGGAGRSAGREDLILIGLNWPIEAINRRINARVGAMVRAGLIDEVTGLSKSGKLGPQAREALGYKQILTALEGRTTLDEAIERVKIETRRYGRQQRSWLKRFRGRPLSLWLEAAGSAPEALANQALTFVLAEAERMGLTGHERKSGRPE